MSRSYKHTPVCNIELPLSGAKKIYNRKFRRTVSSDEDFPSGGAYKKLDNRYLFDRWKSYETKAEFIDKFQQENGRTPSQQEVFEGWGQWNRNK